MTGTPIDTATGLQSGSEVHGTVEVLKGWLVIHADGFEARLGPDRARAEVYVRQHRAVSIEPMYVRRPTAQIGPGGANGGRVGPG